jgi:hypothetical protein
MAASCRVSDKIVRGLRVMGNIGSSSSSLPIRNAY